MSTKIYNGFRLPAHPSAPAVAGTILGWSDGDSDESRRTLVLLGSGSGDA